MLDLGTAQVVIAAKTLDAINELKNVKNETEGVETQTDKSTKAINISWGNVATAVSVVKEGFDLLSSGLTKIYDTAKSAAVSADTVLTEAAKMGLTAEQYQEMVYAADKSDVAVETIAKSWAKINTVLNGTSESFTGVGIAIENTDGTMRSSEEIFWDTIDYLSQLDDAAEQERLANELLGKSYQDLMPLINLGKEGYQDLMQEAHDYGAVQSDEQLAQAGALSDSLDSMKSALEGFSNTVGTLLAPLVQEITDMFGPLIGDITNMLSDGLDEGEAKEIGEKVGNFISNVLDFAVDALPNLIDSIISAFGAILEALIPKLPEIAGSFVKLIVGLLETLVSHLPEILSAAAQIIVGIGQSLIEMLLSIIPDSVKKILGIPVIRDDIEEFTTEYDNQLKAFALKNNLDYESLKADSDAIEIFNKGSYDEDMNGVDVWTYLESALNEGLFNDVQQAISDQDMATAEKNEETAKVMAAAGDKMGVSAEQMEKWATGAAQWNTYGVPGSTN